MASAAITSAARTVTMGVWMERGGGGSRPSATLGGRLAAQRVGRWKCRSSLCYPYRTYIVVLAIHDSAELWRHLKVQGFRFFSDTGGQKRTAGFFAAQRRQIAIAGRHHTTWFLSAVSPRRRRSMLSTRMSTRFAS